MDSTKTVTVTVRPEFDEFIQAMRQVAEMFNDVADQLAALNDHTETEETDNGNHA